MATVHTKVLERAAQILGGYDRLQGFLGISNNRIRRWLDGSSPLPVGIFLKLVDIVSDESLRKIAGATPSFAAKSQAGRYAQAQASGISLDTTLRKTKLLREAIEKCGIAKQKPLSVS